MPLVSYSVAPGFNLILLFPSARVFHNKTLLTLTRGLEMVCVGKSQLTVVCFETLPRSVLRGPSQPFQVGRLG